MSTLEIDFISSQIFDKTEETRALKKNILLSKYKISDSKLIYPNLFKEYGLFLS
jgi:hypothetical protein